MRTGVRVCVCMCVAISTQQTYLQEFSLKMLKLNLEFIKIPRGLWTLPTFQQHIVCSCGPKVKRTGNGNWICDLRLL